MQQLADVSDDIELLVQLTAKRFSVGFGRVAFAAGKLPVAFEMRAGGTKREKTGVAACNDRGDDCDGHASNYHYLWRVAPRRWIWTMNSPRLSLT